MDYTAHTIASGFAFPECPRWHEGNLWFSDQHDAKVRRLGPEGRVLEEIAVPGGASGLGWLPSGDLLVVSMKERRLYRHQRGALLPYAELSGVHPHQSNDMVVDAQGRAWVGNIGFDFHAGESPKPTAIARVDADASVHCAATDLMCPNGSVITPDARTLIVAESMASRLTAFTIENDGSLSGRRVFAQLPEGHVPDGICLDAEGCVWYAAPYSNAVFRVREGGEMLDRVNVSGAMPYACMLGGSSRRYLYVCVAPDHDPDKTLALRGGRIDLAPVAVAGVGWP